MLIHVFGDVRYVEVSVTVVGELLELGVERFLKQSAELGVDDREISYSSEADFVAKIVEATNAVFGIFEIVILDESKAV